MEATIERERASVAEYLRRERQSLDKHEYRNGEILLMAGASAIHSLIVVNLLGELRNRLKGAPCRAYDSNLRIRIPRTVSYCYPDVSVLCGPRETDPNDSTGETYTNSKLIIEVLSPSTEIYDRGEKFRQYLQLDSLQEYVLVSQHVRRVETYFRQPDGTWLFRNAAEGSVPLPSIGVELPLDEIYAGVELPPT